MRSIEKAIITLKYVNLFIELLNIFSYCIVLVIYIKKYDHFEYAACDASRSLPAQASADVACKPLFSPLSTEAITICF